MSDQKGFADLSAQIERFMAVNKNVSKNTDLYNNMQRVRNEVANCTGDLQSQRTAWAQLEAQAEQLGLTVESIDQKLVRLFKEHFQTAMIMAGLHLIQQGTQQVYQNVVEINTAMTELKKVTDETDATYDQFLLNAADKAKKLGATIQLVSLNRWTAFILMLYIMAIQIMILELCKDCLWKLIGTKRYSKQNPALCYEILLCTF